MAFENIRSEFRRLSEEHSHILMEIKQAEVDIINISERMDELRKQGAEGTDAWIKARDRRRRLRDELPAMEHKARMIAIEIETLKLSYKFLGDGGAS